MSIRPASPLIQRADYQAPAFWIDTVNLTFDLDPAKTRVLNLMTLRHNPDATPQALRLDGQDLNLARVLVNGAGASFKIDGGKLVLDQAFGSANLASGEALTPAHLFRVASHSKTFTAVGIMRLVEAGKLRLDDAAGQHVQGLHPEVAKATIAQLLSHTAGIVRDGGDTGQWQDRRPFLNEAELRAALAEPPVIPANTRMKYSNHGFGLAGLVIAAVTGESYNDWIAREVVKRAGLPRTAPDAPVDAKLKTSRGHSSKLALGERLVIPADNCTHALASATGFLSTAGDLATFYASLDPAAPKSILSAASRREITRRQWPIADTPGERAYGLGIIHSQVGDWPIYGHSGGFQGVKTQTATIPSQKLTVSVLTNAADGNPQLLLEGVVHILRAFARHGAPAKTVADLRTTEILMGSTGAAGENSALPLVMNALAGTKMKLVKGYGGQSDVFLALERGEVQGNTTGIINLRTDKAEWVSSGKVRILLR